MSAELISGRFVARPNRFIVEARLEGGALARAHLNDPGRLEDLLLESTPLRLRPAPAGTEGKRSTRFSVALAQAPDSDLWVSLETTRANALAESWLRENTPRGLRRPGSIRREVRCGDHRFDLLLNDATWVEVKSVTLAQGPLGLFPDAPTARGLRHVRALTERVTKHGEGALLLFVAQRGDIERIRPHHTLDPEFAEGVRAAREAGVLVRGIRVAFDRQGRALETRPVPVVGTN